MDLLVERITHGLHASIGIAFYIPERQAQGAFACFVLEDIPRDVKVPGQTRITSGTYPLKLRTEGGFHQRYLARFGDQFHKGMLWLQNVRGYDFVLIHCGNTDQDTEGCLLLGATASVNKDGDGTLADSVGAYTRVYPVLRDALLRGEACAVTILNRDK